MKKVQYALFRTVTSLGVTGPRHRSSRWRRDIRKLPDINRYRGIDPGNKVTEIIGVRHVPWWRWVINSNKGDDMEFRIVSDLNIERGDYNGIQYETWGRIK